MAPSQAWTSASPYLAAGGTGGRTHKAGAALAPSPRGGSSSQASGNQGAAGLWGLESVLRPGSGGSGDSAGSSNSSRGDGRPAGTKSPIPRGTSTSRFSGDGHDGGNPHASSSSPASLHNTGGGSSGRGGGGGATVGSAQQQRQVTALYSRSANNSLSSANSTGQLYVGNSSSASSLSVGGHSGSVAGRPTSTPSTLVGGASHRQQGAMQLPPRPRTALATAGSGATGGGLHLGSGSLASTYPQQQQPQRQHGMAPSTAVGGALGGTSGTAPGRGGTAAQQPPATGLQQSVDYAAGSPALSLREKVTVLQKRNKTLEKQVKQLQEVADRWQTEATAQHCAAQQAPSLDSRVSELEAALAAALKQAQHAQQQLAQWSLQAAKQQQQHLQQQAQHGLHRGGLDLFEICDDVPTSPRSHLGAAAEPGLRSAGSSTSSSPVADLLPPSAAPTAGALLLRQASTGARVATYATDGGAAGELMSPRGAMPLHHSPASAAHATTAVFAAGKHGDISTHATTTVSCHATPYEDPEVFPRAHGAHGSTGAAGGGARPRSPSPKPTAAHGAWAPHDSAAINRRLSGGHVGRISGSGWQAPGGSQRVSLSGTTAEAEAQLLRLERDLKQAQGAFEFMRSEHADLEGQLKDMEAQRRDFAARYAFMVLDQDADGYIRAEQVRMFDMFAPYSPLLLEFCLRHWRYSSGFKGFLTMEDFLRLVHMADDRTTKASQSFWFSVIDMDGDGFIGPEDVKQVYDAVPNKGDGFVVSFPDLWTQLLDMVCPKDPKAGITITELRSSKLAPGVLGLLLNHNNMLLQRTTAEWGRGEFPL